MTTSTIAALFKVCQAAESIDVMNVHGAAGDNAADAMGSRFVKGNFDDEFLGHWYGTLQSILSDGDDVTEEARTFFESIGVRY